VLLAIGLVPFWAAVSLGPAAPTPRDSTHANAWPQWSPDAWHRSPAADGHPEPGGVSLIDLVVRKLVKTIALAGTPDGVAVVR
jgi:hypothetical protein